MSDSMKSDSYCDVTSGPRGQKVVRVFGRDDSSSGVGISDAESKNGRKMGGSATNIGHSINGASAVQHVKGD